VNTAGPVLLQSAPGMEALARDAGLSNVSPSAQQAGTGAGLGPYVIDLSR
jgi:hypothetical protein